MALVGGISAFITYFIIIMAYLPVSTREKWEERKAWDIPMPQPYDTGNCPRCEAIIPINSKFYPECGGRVN